MMEGEMNFLGGIIKEDIKRVMEITGLPSKGTVEDLVRIVKQEWLRPAGVERWEMESIHEDKRMELLPIFSEMGLVKAREETEDSYEHILFMGGFISRMSARRELLQLLLGRPISYSTFTFLSGARFLVPEEKYSLKKQGWDSIPETEGEVYPRFFEGIGIPSEKMRWVNASQKRHADGTLARPTTSDTLELWLKTNPTPGKVVMISSQPLSSHHERIARLILPETFPLTVVASDAPCDTPVAVYLDTIARVVCGGYYSKKGKD
jgi:hypothetical protein